LRVKKIEFGLKGARNYFWYRAQVNLLTALVVWPLWRLAQHDCPSTKSINPFNYHWTSVFRV